MEKKERGGGEKEKEFDIYSSFWFEGCMYFLIFFSFHDFFRFPCCLTRRRRKTKIFQKEKREEIGFFYSFLLQPLMFSLLSFRECIG